MTRRLIGEYVSHRPQSGHAVALDVLTYREREVVALAARGLSNDETPPTWSSASPPPKPTSAGP